jgi:DNA polymerase sigma
MTCRAPYCVAHQCTLLLHLQVDKEWVNDERPFMLAVEDPKDPTNDICR